MSARGAPDPAAELAAAQRYIATLERQLHLRREGESFAGASLSLAAAKPKEIHSFAGLQEAILHVDAQCHVIYANRNVAELLGVPKSEIEHRLLADVDRFPWGEGFLTELWRRTQREGAPLTVEQEVAAAADRPAQVYSLTVYPGDIAQITINDISRLFLVENAFARYLSPTLLEQVISQGIETLAPRKAETTILFADLRSFTATAETAAPDHLARVLNDFYDATTKIIVAHGGFVDKYIGDEVMALFGAPVRTEDHLLSAVEAAVALQQAATELRAAWQRAGLPVLSAGIGVNSGSVLVGNFGGANRISYTAIGHVVNLAARLTGAASRDEILLTRAVYERLKNFCQQRPERVRRQFQFAAVGKLSVKGVAEPVEVISVAAPAAG